MTLLYSIAQENNLLVFTAEENKVSLNKEEEIFTGICKEKNHHIELKYFCKNHNKLCCAACIAKINRIGDGQHKDCDVCTIQDIREEKKKKLKNNIINLENLNEKLKDSISELNKLYNKIDQNKEDFYKI